MTQTTWILDANILERLTYSSRSLVEVLESLGHKAVLIERQENGSYPKPEVPEGPVVLYGSHMFTKSIDSAELQPGALGVNERTRATQYMSNLPLDWFLNRDGMFMTWAMFKHRARELFYEHDTNMLFIRPDSGFKTFAGQRILYGTLDHDISTLDQTSAVMNDTLCLVHPGTDIQGEFRFVIADRKVIAGSEYRWDGKLDIRRDWTPECEALAQQVADHEWQIDIAYTCDVALTPDGARVVELNGFSCAGMYACDLELVVQGVSRAATREFFGDDI